MLEGCGATAMAVASGVKKAAFSNVSAAVPADSAISWIIAMVNGEDGAEAWGPPKLKHTRRARPTRGSGSTSPEGGRQIARERAVGGVEGVERGLGRAQRDESLVVHHVEVEGCERCRITFQPD